MHLEIREKRTFRDEVWTFQIVPTHKPQTETAKNWKKNMKNTCKKPISLVLLDCPSSNHIHWSVIILSSNNRYQYFSESRHRNPSESAPDPGRRSESWWPQLWWSMVVPLHSYKNQEIGHYLSLREDMSLKGWGEWANPPIFVGEPPHFCFCSIHTY